MTEAVWRISRILLGPAGFLMKDDAMQSFASCPAFSHPAMSTCSPGPWHLAQERPPIVVNFRPSCELPMLRSRMQGSKRTAA